MKASAHLKHLLVASSLVKGHKGMQVSQLRPADGNHFSGGVQLHGAATQGNHGVREGQVLVLQPLQVAQHLVLTLIEVKDFVLQEGCGPLEAPYTCLNLCPQRWNKCSCQSDSYVDTEQSVCSLLQHQRRQLKSRHLTSKGKWTKSCWSTYCVCMYTTCLTITSYCARRMLANLFSE